MLMRARHDWFFIGRLFSAVIGLCLLGSVQAGSPIWTFAPLTSTTLSVPSNDTTIVQYQITNQSSKTRVLAMQALTGVTQLTTGLGVCGNPLTLTGDGSCTLSLQINGSELTKQISDGPIVCEEGSVLQCYRPAPQDVLHITQAPPITDATIEVVGSPLMLVASGVSGLLTINNLSLMITATNIASDFTGTALDGKVTETGNTCASVLPGRSCTLTYTPGSTEVPLTDFPIQGDNTNRLTAAIEVDSGIVVSNVSPASGPASGGTGVVVSGSGFTGVTGVTFGGVAATSVKIENSTTVTAVTPAHAVGAVDVILTGPTGSGTATNGYTYEPTAVGQSAYGGTIACLNEGGNNLIAATADSGTYIVWGGIQTVTTASSNTDGATNTTTIVDCLTNSKGCPIPLDPPISADTYAAGVCSTYQVDSQGNTPCESGNACYDDWFLPAGNNRGALGQLNCLFVNRAAIGGFETSVNPYYWSSTELGGDPAWTQDFRNGNQYDFFPKDASNVRVRCVRAFTP